MREGRTFEPPAPERHRSLDELRNAEPTTSLRRLNDRYLLRTRGKPSRYEPAMWAFAFNRLTGLLLFFYVIVHLVALLFLPEVYETSSPGHGLIQAIDVLAVGAVAFHGLNGVRLLSGDLGLLRSRRAHYRAIALIAGLTVLAVIGALVRVST